MIRIGVWLVVAGMLVGCQKSQISKNDPRPNWKPQLLAKYDANKDGELTGAELKAAIQDKQVIAASD